ncbi:hypothetical protein NQ314_001348 [Rhamnusium bicolor]|uniref:CCAAT-binding factor domain-containing protein n=1 Tax=Rhamnusium bicolor TaxID=1586634 RepID=A0AAV8ZSH0_9CUCU|nr:hypothetical protein NQ314_001348 [Rhamnusium bicolor]
MLIYWHYAFDGVSYGTFYNSNMNLLSYIVNKLGDPSQKVASKAIYCLTQLLFKHSNMQGVVLNEIEKLLFRPNISSRAQYYSLCFLSQFYLSHEASDVARKLIELYLSFFKACIKTGDVDSRMMSALLMGINRAYPYAKLEFEKFSEHIDTMYRLVHLANFNISLHALTLLYQVSGFGNDITERFYVALYKKLGDSRLLTTTHQAMLLSLVYKALLKDTEANRVKMFVKRLLQVKSFRLTICSRYRFFTQPCFSCGILYLISQLMGKRKNVQAVVLEKTSTVHFEDDDEEERYHDVKENVVNVEDSIEVNEIKEEIEDVEKKEEDIEENTRAPSESTIDPNEIEIKDEDEDIKPDIELLDESINGGPSWYHCQNKIKKEKVHMVTKYNPQGRNPLYGGGEFCAYTELYKLKDHFHPTVSLYAANILSGATIKYSGDPLKDFTLIRFLDSYLQRKYQDKTKEEEENSDLESVQSEEFEEMLDKMSGFKDIEEDIDYLNEIGDNLKNKDLKKEKAESEYDEEEENEELSDNEEFDDYDDELGDLDDDDKAPETVVYYKTTLKFYTNDILELIGGLDDDDEEDMEFMEEDEPRKQKKNKFKKNSNDITSLFASADEFATLLEDEGSSKIKPGGSNVYSNKDNANVKQLAWEDKRNVWLRGFNKAVDGNSRRKFGSKGKDFGKKRSNQSKFGNKSKKIKN